MNKNVAAQRNAEQVQAMKRISAIGRNLFSSKEGLELLEYFKSVTIDLPVFSKGVEAGKQATHAAFREGENGIIRQLMTFSKP